MVFLLRVEDRLVNRSALGGKLLVEFAMDLAMDGTLRKGLDLIYWRD
jgi:hypothetical protein